MQNKPDLKTSALEIAASPHSFAGQDISALIHELVGCVEKTTRLIADGYVITAPYWQSYTYGIDIEKKEAWLCDVEDYLRCSNEVTK